MKQQIEMLAQSVQLSPFRVHPCNELVQNCHLQRCIQRVWWLPFREMFAYVGQKTLLPVKNPVQSINNRFCNIVLKGRPPPIDEAEHYLR